jgi:hypothetical protein
MKDQKLVLRSSQHLHWVSQPATPPLKHRCSMLMPKAQNMLQIVEIQSQHTRFESARRIVLFHTPVRQRPCPLTAASGILLHLVHELLMSATPLEFSNSEVWFINWEYASFSTDEENIRDMSRKGKGRDGMDFHIRKSRYVAGFPVFGAENDMISSPQWAMPCSSFHRSLSSPRKSSALESENPDCMCSSREVRIDAKAFRRVRDAKT